MSEVPCALKRKDSKNIFGGNSRASRWREMILDGVCGQKNGRAGRTGPTGFRPRANH